MKEIKMQDVYKAFAIVNRRTFNDVTKRKLYKLDSVKLAETINGYMKSKNKATLGACYTDIGEKIGYDKRRIQDLISFCRTGIYPRETAGDPLKDGTVLSCVRGIGTFFGEEDAFLQVVDVVDEEGQKQEKKKEKIREIVAMIDGVLRQIDKSAQYNYLPDGSRKDGWEYYDDSLEEIEHKLMALLCGEGDVEKRLKNLIEETRIFVRSFSRPGVVQRWCEISPEITYFDCVYDVMESNRSTYESTKEMFTFQPTDVQVKARQKYFDAVYEKNAKNNTQYSEDRLFQEEVLRTFGKVVRHDFPELVC